MHDTSALVRARAQRFLSERLRPARYRDRAPIELSRWEAPGEPVPFREASTQTYEAVAVGQPWGKPWGTTWFRVQGEIPARWADLPGTRAELIADIGFTDVQTGFQCEGTAYAADGRVIKGVEPFNRHVPLPEGPGSAVEVFIEASSNPDVINGWSFEPTELGVRATAGDDDHYRTTEIAIGLLDLEVADLVIDVEVLLGLVDQLDDASARRARVLRALEAAVAAVDPEHVWETAHLGRAELAEVLASPAQASAHRVFAVGHAHIDSAWLWPIRETARKVARTFSNVLDLMDADPDFVFAASSAQQYAWLKELYPDVFERVRERVAQGRFVPVGGMWVESDTNLPGGEALVRQLVLGSQFFREEFGIDQPEVWLPDTFGYSAALPQLIRLAGAQWFLTQKISWNETNRMPHHTFWWEGLDGTRVFTHFPPVDSYCSDLSAADLARAERQFAEKGEASVSLVPYGYGDGGGGPTREMLGVAARKKSLEGSARVELAGPHEFFAEAQREYPNAPVWSGELYLEFHRGTYTSQAETKRLNRRSESLLREAELWAAAAQVTKGVPYPYGVLEDAWRTVLLHQFHDILPGTCIGWVYEETTRRYAEVAAALEAVIAASLTALAGDGELELDANAGPRPVAGALPLGITPAAPAPTGVAVRRADDGALVVTTAHLRVTIDGDGLVTSLWDVAAEREVVPAGRPANLLQLFRDTPNQWDAWDIDEVYRRHHQDLTVADAVELVESGPERAVIRVRRSFGASRVSQELVIAAGAPTITITTTVDWHERQKLLKLAFPLDVHADEASSEIQFGHVKRPTHANTSWDAARFETPAQRWVHVGEPGYGVAIANDATYGHDITRAGSTDGSGTVTLVRLSLLRAPLYPDPQADQGRHTFTVSVRVGAEISDAVSEGYRLNLPPRRLRGATPFDPLVRVDDPAVTVEAVKLAQDGSGDVVVRLYEALGGRARATLTPGFDVAEVVETDLHERGGPGFSAITRVTEGVIGLHLRPFQVVTLRLRRGTGSA